MMNRRNYYRILQVQPDAPPEIIRASYRTLMKELKAPTWAVSMPPPLSLMKPMKR